MTVKCGLRGQKFAHEIAHEKSIKKSPSGGQPEGVEQEVWS